MSVIWTILRIYGYISVGALIVLGIFALLLSPLVIDTLFARPTDCRLDLYRVVHRRGGSVSHRQIQHHEIRSVKERRRAVLWLPGILARENQIDPIVSLFTGRDVYAVCYAGRRFDGPNVAVPQVAVMLHMLANAYDEIIVIGTSHGGMLGTEAIDGLSAGVKSKIKLFVVFDSPTCEDDLLQMPHPAIPFFTWFRPGVVSNVVFAWVLPLLNKMGGGPKEINIIRPNKENLQRLGLPHDMTYRDYVDWVMASAKVNLAGHRFSMWYSELRDMIESGRRGLPYAGLHGIDVMYIECLRNDTVKQPDAVTIWANKAHARVYQLDMTHCGMVENLDAIVTLLKVDLRYR